MYRRAGSTRLRAVGAVMAAVTVAGSLLGGCGPPSSAPSADPPSTTPTTTAPVDPALQSGDLDTEALSGFACAPDSSGAWTASGTVINDGADDAAYVVTVVVAGPDSTAAQAKRQVIGLRSGDSAALEISTLPLPTAGELSCQAQVVRR